ncbi:pilus assembly protein TadE [Vibrio albus]|uniref:Pilus assembly protein TadE n=1 Tax=Vibrio albus TaxID=2200953 RepID=A0A2U3BEM4_9VIBR|nr:TadE/TadG family type IV pilus assembly protein [Vibrio albus]PWI35231.1 pilus assembly protein TadE [Vibrio albus]
MKRIKSHLGKAWQKGVASIEFALGFFAFWLLIGAWAEMSYISYITAICDLAITEASRSAKKTELDPDNVDSHYQKIFEKVISEDDFWSKFVDVDSLTANMTVRYVDNLSSLAGVTDVCVPPGDNGDNTCGSESGSSLAIYHVSYDYNSIFSYFSDKNSVFSREIIVVQEYERSQFDI